jgi:hypothetical protein
MEAYKQARPHLQVENSLTGGQYHKTSRIRNLHEKDKFRGKLMPRTNIPAHTNTLAYYGVRTLQICNLL